MIAFGEGFDGEGLPYDVKMRGVTPPVTARRFLETKIERTGRQRMANESRFSRGGQAKTVNGPHRRGGKKHTA